jgi:hypothetical protein
MEALRVAERNIEAWNASDVETWLDARASTARKLG